MTIATAPSAMARAANEAPCAALPGSAANTSPGRTDPVRRLMPLTATSAADGSLPATLPAALPGTLTAASTSAASSRSGTGRRPTGRGGGMEVADTIYSPKFVYS